jgi:AcrR family transcriptional regulator
MTPLPTPELGDQAEPAHYPAAPGALGGEAASAERDARERILHAAYELFCRHGVASTGIDRIVAEAGVAKMTLYRHFPSKDALATAVIELRAELFTHRWLAYEIERRATTPAAGLLAIFDLFDEWFHRDGFESCLFIKCLFETAGEGGPVSEAAGRELEAIRALLRRLAGDAGARDPTALAYELQVLMSGAIVLATDGDADAARRARAVAELILRREGLQPE